MKCRGAIWKFTKRQENIVQQKKENLQETKQFFYAFTKLVHPHSFEHIANKSQELPHRGSCVSLILIQQYPGMGHLRIFPEFRIFFFFTSVEKKNLSPAS